MQLIIQNTREPEDRLLDLKVQIATNVLGGANRRADRTHGSGSVDRAVEDHDLQRGARARESPN